MNDIDWKAQPERMLKVRAREAALESVRKPKVLQRYRVLQLAIGHPEGFTRWTAANEAGCFELAARIGELESEGVLFERHRSTGRNRYGDSVRVMTYRLAYVPAVLAAHARFGAFS